jgi:ABC-type dipeptide/oligopeptide/nickel transport systems, permease components
MHRFKFVLYRPVQLIPVLIGISIVTFILVHAIPGDPARLLLGAKATPEAIAAIHAKYGLDRPIPVQYLLFIKNLLHGEFGQSIIYRAPVLGGGGGSHRAHPVSADLCRHPGGADGGPAGLAGGGPARAADGSGDPLFSTIGLGLPAFWLGIVLIMFFSIRLGWFPVSGYGDDFLDRLHHLFLPAFTVALATAPILTRNLRASLIAESQADYVSAARAKGLPRHVIFFHHIFRNSLIPTINLLGVNVGWLIGGTVVVESVFSVPGLGSLLVSSIFARDYLVVQAITLILALGVIATNFTVDIVTVALDPRIQP